MICIIIFPYIILVLAEIAKQCHSCYKKVFLLGWERGIILCSIITSCPNFSFVVHVIISVYLQSFESVFVGITFTHKSSFRKNFIIRKHFQMFLSNVARNVFGYLKAQTIFPILNPITKLLSC